MSINYAEGFDDGIYRGVLQGNVAPSISTVAVRTGTRSLRCQTSGASQVSYYQFSVPDAAEGFLYFALYIGSLPGGNQTLVSWLDGGTTHTQLQIRNDGRFQVYRGLGATLLQTGTFVYTPSTWVSFGIRTLINDTTGLVEVRINGNPTPDINITGADTRNGANALYNLILMGIMNSSTNVTGVPYYFDDIVHQDTGGSAPENTWFKDPEVLYSFPVGSGDSSQGTIGGSSPAATRWESLDEVAPDDGVTTVDFATSGELLLMNFGDIPVTSGTIYAVIPVIRAQKASAGARALRPVAKLSTTTMNGSNLSLSTSWISYQGTVWHDDPSGNPWTPGNFNSAQFGMESQ